MRPWRDLSHHTEWWSQKKKTGRKPKATSQIFYFDFEIMKATCRKQEILKLKAQVNYSFFKVISVTWKLKFEFSTLQPCSLVISIAQNSSTDKGIFTAMFRDLVTHKNKNFSKTKKNLDTTWWNWFRFNVQMEFILYSWFTLESDSPIVI